MALCAAVVVATNVTEGPWMDEREDRIERSGPGRRESDHPSMWQNPGLWVSILGLLLAICGIIGGYVSKQLGDLHTDLQRLNDTQIRTFTEQGKDIGYLKESQKRVNDDLREQNAYNLNMATKMTEIVTTMRQRGMPAPNVPDPPKLGGQ